MATPIQEKVDQNLKVNLEIFSVFISKKKRFNDQIRTGMVTVSDGKTQPELVRIQLTMELLILQRMDTSTPPPIFGPPIESKVIT